MLLPQVQHPLALDVLLQVQHPLALEVLVLGVLSPQGSSPLGNWICLVDYHNVDESDLDAFSLVGRPAVVLSRILGQSA